MKLFQAMAGAATGGAEAFFERLALAFQRAGVEQRVGPALGAGRVGVEAQGQVRHAGRRNRGERQAVTKDEA